MRCSLKRAERQEGDIADLDPFIVVCNQVILRTFFPSDVLAVINGDYIVAVLEGKEPRSQSQKHLDVILVLRKTVRPWTTSLTSLSVSFLICEMEMPLFAHSVVLDGNTVSRTLQALGQV